MEGYPAGSTSPDSREIPDFTTKLKEYDPNGDERCLGTHMGCGRSPKEWLILTGERSTSYRIICQPKIMRLLDH